MSNGEPSRVSGRVITANMITRPLTRLGSPKFSNFVKLTKGISVICSNSPFAHG